MSRRVTMFQSEFAPQVEARTKRHTIRKKGKRTTKVGDIMDAREWTGKAYRSKTRKLLESPVTKVQNILIGIAEIYVDGRQLSDPEICELAAADGFNDYDSTEDFFTFFSTSYGLPFEGQIIHWK